MRKPHHVNQRHRVDGTSPRWRPSWRGYAGLRRGIKEDILADGFRISGLGQLIEAGIAADRLVTFGD